LTHQQVGRGVEDGDDNIGAAADINCRGRHEIPNVAAFHGAVVMQNKTGGVVSRTVTTWVKAAELLQESVAVQVRVAEKVWPTMHWCRACDSQQDVGSIAMSMTAGSSKSQVAPHSTVRLVTPVNAAAWYPPPPPFA